MARYQVCLTHREGNVVTNATVVTGGGPLPEAFMRIVNGEGQTVTTAEIGQTLYAEVTLKEVGGKPGTVSDDRKGLQDRFRGDIGRKQT